MASKYSLDFDDAFSSDTSETSSSHQKDSLNEKQISLVNNLIDQKLAIYLSAVKQPFTSAPVSAAGLFQQLEALNGFATDSARAAIIKIERTLDRGKQSEEEEIRARRLLSLFVAANSSRKRLLAALSHLSTEMQEDVSKIRRGEWSEMEEGEDKNGPCSGLSTRDRLKYLKFEFSQTENEIKVYAERLREQSAVVLEMIVAEIKAF